MNAVHDAAGNYLSPSGNGASGTVTAHFGDEITSFDFLSMAEKADVAGGFMLRDVGPALLAFFRYAAANPGRYRLVRGSYRSDGLLDLHGGGAAFMQGTVIYGDGNSPYGYLNGSKIIYNGATDANGVFLNCTGLDLNNNVLSNFEIDCNAKLGTAFQLDAWGGETNGNKQWLIHRLSFSRALRTPIIVGQNTWNGSDYTTAMEDSDCHLNVFEDCQVNLVAGCTRVAVVNVKDNGYQIIFSRLTVEGNAVQYADLVNMIDVVSCHDVVLSDCFVAKLNRDAPTSAVLRIRNGNGEIRGMRSEEARIFYRSAAGAYPQQDVKIGGVFVNDPSQGGTAKAITGAANNGSGLIRITAVAHGWQTGRSVTIRNVLGTTEANDDTWTITRIDADHFDLQGSAFVHAYVSGGSAYGDAVISINDQSGALLTLEGNALSSQVGSRVYSRRVVSVGPVQAAGTVLGNTGRWELTSLDKSSFDGVKPGNAISLWENWTLSDWLNANNPEGWYSFDGTSGAHVTTRVTTNAVYGRYTAQIVVSLASTTFCSGLGKDLTNEQIDVASTMGLTVVVTGKLSAADLAPRIFITTGQDGGLGVTDFIVNTDLTFDARASAKPTRGVATSIFVGLVAGQTGTIHIDAITGIPGRIDDAPTAIAAFRSAALPGRNLAPAEFEAVDAAGVANATGDATAFQVVFGTEIRDRNFHYNNGTGLFTAQAGGPHLFRVSLALSGLAAGHTTGLVELVTSNRTYQLFTGNVGVMRDAANKLTLSGSEQCDMDVGDTAFVRLTVSGAAKVVGLVANGSFCSGELVR